MHQRSVTYRQEIVEPLLHSLVAGECCSVVGISGVGKSNLVLQLQRRDVLAHYLGDTAGAMRFVSVDANLLTNWEPWGVLEGLADALLTTLGHELPAAVQQQLRASYEQVLYAPGQHALALRRCAEAIAVMCATWRVVVVFDEFDSLFTALDPQVLRHLRGLRDRYKYHLVFLTFSREPLADLRPDDWDAIEPFLELLSLRELGLGPLSSDDACGEVDRFAARHGAAVVEPVRAQIAALSGGHPALLRALVQEVLLDPERFTGPVERLIQIPTIRLECTKVWQALTAEEQDAIVQVVQGQLPPPAELMRVQLKGLVTADRESAPAPFSPLIAAYTLSRTHPTSVGQVSIIRIDPTKQLVSYYGQDISGQLRPLEYRLLAYLWERGGAICSVEETATALYGPTHPDDLSRIRILAGQLRRKLERLAPGEESALRIYHSRGYQLTQ